MAHSANLKMDKIKILIADDHAVVLQGLKEIISKTNDLAVVEEAQNGNEVLEKIRKVDVDVLIMDIEMPEKSGWEVLMELKNIRPKLPVIILSFHSEKVYGVRLLKAGASGYLAKTSVPGQLVEAVRKVAGGGKFVSSVLAEELVLTFGEEWDRPLHENLSAREFQIFCLIASGKRLKTIAEELSLSVTTVSTHRGHILEKLRMTSNAELIHYAIKNGIIN